MSILQIRLRNCIQTILDLEPTLREGIRGCLFDVELTALRKFLGEVDRMPLEEEDVRRMENATAMFLSDIRGTIGGSAAQPHRVLQ